MKSYVLDTNVLLRDGYSLHKFENNDIYLPITVIEELDKFKKGFSSTAQNARIASRIIDKLRGKGKLQEGVSLGSNLGKLYIKNGDLIDNTKSNNDDKILSFIKRLQEKIDKEVILVSKDLNMRIKANVLGITGQDYESDKVSDDVKLFQDNHLEVDNNTLMKLYQDGKVKVNMKLDNNSYWMLTIDGMNAIPVKYKDGIFYRINQNITIQKTIKARNLEQACLMDALLDDDIKVIFVVGTAGSGKTQLVLASMLEALDRKKYKKLYVTRPTIPVGGSKYNEYGFLPGDLNEKLNPWFSAIFDNLSNIIDYNSKELINQDFIELGAIGFLRGRTLKNTFIFVDEAQGTTPMEIKTILSRVGENSKIVFAGDIQQIDNPLLSTYDNGLTYATNKLKGKDAVSILYMKECQRSYVASLAEEL